MVEDKQICELYTYGFSQVTISKMIGCSEDRVRKILRECSIRVRTNSEQALKYSFNEGYFDIIDTEEKAYWLGFLYADGYVTKARKHCSPSMGISIMKSDKNHLEKFRFALKSNHAINDYDAITTYGETSYSRLIITNLHVVEALKKLGVVEQKTMILEFPTEEQVPIIFQLHFIRGYFDGDGSISITDTEKSGTEFKYRYYGTLQFLEGVKKVLDFPHEVLPHKSIWYLELGGNNQVLKHLEKLYGEANIYLERKYERYQRLRVLQNSR